MQSLGYTADWVDLNSPSHQINALAWAGENPPDSCTDRGRLVVHTDATSCEEQFVIDQCKYIWYERIRTASEAIPNQDLSEKVVNTLLSCAKPPEVSKDVLQFLGTVLRSLHKRPAVDPHCMVDLPKCWNRGLSVSETVGGSIAVLLVHGNRSSAVDSFEASTLISNGRKIQYDEVMRGYDAFDSSIPRPLLDVISRPRAVFDKNAEPTTIETVSNAI